MAWVSPRVYAILSSSEEGKDIIEQLPDMTQDECSQALDEFFGKGGKGYKSNAEYSQAKMDDETEERIYKEMGDEEASEKDYEEYDTDEDAEEDDTQYRINGTNGQVFSSLEEAKNAVSGKKVEAPKDGQNEPKKLDDIIKEHSTVVKDKDYDAYSFKKDLEENGYKVEYIENRSGTWQEHNGKKFKEYDIKLDGGQHIYFRLIADENYDTKEIIAYKNGKNW